MIIGSSKYVLRRYQVANRGVARDTVHVCRRCRRRFYWGPCERDRCPLLGTVRRRSGGGGRRPDREAMLDTAC